MGGRLKRFGGWGRGDLGVSSGSGERWLESREWERGWERGRSGRDQY